MKHRHILTSVVFGLLSIAYTANAANELFGTVISSGTGRLVTYNLATGARTNVGGSTVANCCFVSGGSTNDVSGNRFWFTGNYTTDMVGTDPQRLFTLSTTTGALLDDDLLTGTGSVGLIEWDHLTPRLLAMIFQSAATSAQLHTLNTTTGARTPIGSSTANCCFISGGASALDFDGGRFFFIGRYSTDAASVSRIFTINTTSGAVVQDPTLPSTNLYNFLEWDPSPGTLYAVVRDTVGSDEDLVTINPTTGGVALVGGNIANCCSVSGAVSSLDPNGNQFFFVGTVTGDAAPRLFTLNLSTGAVVNNPLLASTEIYNFIEFAPTPLPVELTTFDVE